MRNSYGEFKLRRAYIILSHGKWILPMVQWINRMEAGGILCTALLAEEEYPSDTMALYITDSAVIFQRLEQAGLAVTVYLHKENRLDNFAKAKYAFEEPQDLDEVYAERVYRRYKGIAWDILETKRCYLRETMVEDVETFYEIYSVPEITHYTEGLFESVIKEREYVQEYIDKVYSFFEFGIWTIVLKETGEIIGRAGLNVREGYDLPELGYVIGAPWQCQGIAKEVCSGILEYARKELGFTQIMTMIQKENFPSVKLAQKLGFKLVEEICKDNKRIYIMHMSTE